MDPSAGGHPPRFVGDRRLAPLDAVLSDPASILVHVFEGLGVGLAVRERAPLPPPDTGDWRPARLSEALPPHRLDDAGLAAELQRVQQIQAALHAYQLALVSEFADRRPASADPRCRPPGADPAVGELAEVSGVSEFFPDELAQVLTCSRTAATVLLEQAEALTGPLRRTGAALADGAIDWPRARVIATRLQVPLAETDPAVLAAVQEAVLPRAPHLSVSALGALVDRELLAHDPAGADARRAEARRRRTDVTRRTPPSGSADGLGELVVTGPVERIAAMWDAAHAHALLLREGGDARHLGELREQALHDLVTRPWDTTRPAVTAQITVLAPLPTLSAATAGPGAPVATEPAEVDGRPITAAHLRRVLEELDGLCPGGLQAPAGGSLRVALTEGATGALRAVVTRAQLERLAEQRCRDHPDDACGCAVLDRPEDVDGYRPSRRQRRYTTTRDRHCRMPGCRNEAGWADLDHVVPHACGGPTSCENLCCLCRRHHRLKTHAPGWVFTMAPDGTLTVTTPSGVTRVTRPPGLRVSAAPVGARPDAAPVARGADDPPPF